MNTTRLTLADLKEQFAKYTTVCNLLDFKQKFNLLRDGRVMCGSEDIFCGWLQHTFGKSVHDLPRDMVDQLTLWMHGLSVVTAKTLTQWSEIGLLRYPDFDDIKYDMVFAESDQRTKFPALMTEEEAINLLADFWSPEPPPADAVAQQPFVDTARAFELVNYTGPAKPIPTSFSEPAEPTVCGYDTPSWKAELHPNKILYYDRINNRLNYKCMHCGIFFDGPQTPVALLTSGITHIPIEDLNAPQFTGEDNRTRWLDVRVETVEDEFDVEFEPDDALVEAINNTTPLVHEEPLEYTCREPRMKNYARDVYVAETAIYKAFTFAHHVVNSLWIARYRQAHGNKIMDDMTITEFKAFWQAFITSAPIEHREYILHRVMGGLFTRENWSEFAQYHNDDALRRMSRRSSLVGKSDQPRRLGGAA